MNSNIDTTGIQRPMVYFVQNSGYVLAVCSFATGSRASGCLFNLTNGMNKISRDSKVNSSLCGELEACKCMVTDHDHLTRYSTVEAYTIEEDGVTTSSIPVPIKRVDVSEHPKSISVCNHPVPTRKPLIPGNKNCESKN